ncbi:NAD(P)-dependent alcohol dehydrogenase [Paenibacillus glycanilyticus]|uniref:zinc-dependent alcohol dehydrogenase family protein n=1 Tax=Paenibacillus glycanilyticus TaxID=126569 RepID=UPI00203D8A77|nr:NAD(P)-dependent alcohol dehydrogenase [Paenibacillus glycanilyticus]MCM3630306.1 NAD(P)-dependent alcohol dehydrogenase [Paenibacillus glycanilyticus]
MGNERNEMRVYRLMSPSLDGLQMVKEDLPEVAPYEVLVKLHAASINYKDTFYIAGERRIPLSRPTIPLSDGAGEVVAVGSGVDRFVPGDRVAGILAQDWLYGAIPAKAYHSITSLGQGIDGVLAEYRIFNQEGLVRLPKNLSYEEGATLPTAAVTAWNAVKDVRSSQTVLILGTGGVALFALQFAKALGATTIITSSSDAKLARAVEAGADHAINYRSHPEWHKEVRRLTEDIGVDHVVETVGSDTLEQSILAARIEGMVHLVGIVPPIGRIDPVPVIFGAVTVRGVRVGSRQLFEEMNAFMERKNIHPILGRRFAFEDAKSAFVHQLNGPDFGKIIVNIDNEYGS